MSERLIEDRRCANGNKEVRCENTRVLGHIYCNACRVALGGYNRYTSPAHKRIHTYRQEFRMAILENEITSKTFG